MGHTRLIEKGTNIYIYEIEDCYGRQMASFDILVDEILTEDDDYVDYNGTLVVGESEVEDAISKYMSRNFPMVHDYMFDIDD
jgi:hypothetical protein